MSDTPPNTAPCLLCSAPDVRSCSCATDKIYDQWQKLIDRQKRAHLEWVRAAAETDAANLGLATRISPRDMEPGEVIGLWVRHGESETLVRVRMSSCSDVPRFAAEVRKPKPSKGHA